MEKKDLYLSDEQLEKVWREPLIGNKDRHDIHIAKASADYAVKKVIENFHDDICKMAEQFPTARQLTDFINRWQALKKLIES